MSFIKERPQQYQVQNNPVSITLANSPYTVPANISEVNVDTAGGNVTVNVPAVARQIKINKTSSDSYVVLTTSTENGEVAGYRSGITYESGYITKDEPWYPYDMMVAILNDEVVAKNKFGKCLSSSWRGAVGVDDYTVVNAAYTVTPSGGHLHFGGGNFSLTSTLHALKNIVISGNGKNSTYILSGTGNTDAILRFGPTNPVSSPIQFTLRDLTVQSILSGDPITNYGVDISNAKLSEIDNCVVTFAKKFCIWVRFNYGFAIRNCYISNAIATGAGISLPLGIAGLKLGDNSRDINYAYAGNVHVMDSEITQCMGAGIFAERASLMSVTNSAIEGNYHHGIVLGVAGAGLAQRVSIESTHFEANNYTNTSNVYDIFSEYGRNVAIKNVQFGKYGTGASKVKAGFGHGHGSIYDFQNCVGLLIYDETGDIVSRGISFIQIPGYGVAKSSSTGTGSEDPIPHGLPLLPTGCKAWIKYLVGARYHTEEIDFDATNVYPTVPLGIAYEWRIE